MALFCAARLFGAGLPSGDWLLNSRIDALFVVESQPIEHEPTCLLSQGYLQTQGLLMYDYLFTRHGYKGIRLLLRFDLTGPVRFCALMVRVLRRCRFLYAGGIWKTQGGTFWRNWTLPCGAGWSSRRCNYEAIQLPVTVDHEADLRNPVVSNLEIFCRHFIHSRR